MDCWVGKVAIVTGASAGIGASIAEHLVIAGLNVVGVARRAEAIEELSKKLSGKKGKLYAFRADLTEEANILQAFEWTTKNVGIVNVLVNNAGTLIPGALTDGDSSAWRTIFDLNVLGLCIATREAIKIMKANKIDGHIIHINSSMGHRILPIPSVNVYPATKFAVTALTETLRQELARDGSKIKITSISPGRTKNEMVTSNKSLPPEIQAVLQNSPILEAEDIANGVLYVLGTPPRVQVHELTILPVGAI